LSSVNVALRAASKVALSVSTSANASTRARKVSGHAGMVCAVCAVCAAARCTSGKPAQRKARATVDRLRFFMAILSAAAMPRRKREKEKSAANNGALASCIA